MKRSSLLYPVSDRTKDPRSLVVALSGKRRPPRRARHVEAKPHDFIEPEADTATVLTAAIDPVLLDSRCAKGRGRDVEIAIRAAGVGWDDIVRRTIYTLHPTEYEVITRAIDEVTGGAAHPAQTIVGITGLAVPGCLIEIECTAVVDS